ncbi:unnamed protein product, partial [Rotaria magnacalcarata]
EVYKLRSNRTEKIETNQTDLSDSSKESDQDEDLQEEKKPIATETSKLDESLREFLWQPTKILTSTTTITEVTDQNGVTVLI